jgi:predicted RNA-binding Zn ribbon-like protein
VPTNEGDVRVVLDFLNTVDVEEGIDRLADQASYYGWLIEHKIVSPRRSDGVAEADLETVRGVRDALRGAVAGRREGRAALRRVQLRMDLAADGTPVLDATGPLGSVLAAVVRLSLDGEWPRMKLCSSPTCEWAFHDRSRNRSGRWCDMQVCGNRAKARSFRARHAAS